MAAVLGVRELGVQAYEPVWHAMQDFTNQRDYPKQQAEFYRSIISGTPVTPSQTSKTTTPAPDFLSQLLGLAVGGAGIWDLLK